MCATPESTTTSAASAGTGTSRCSRVPQSISTAWPSRPRSAAAWSRIPHGTPTARSSARWHASASSSGSTSKSATAQSTSAAATSSAADDESPAPTGRSERTVPVEADGGPAEQVELGSDRLRVAGPALRRRAAPVGGEGRRGAEALREERDLTLGGSGVDRDPVLDRDGKHEPAAVVGVLADQVDAPGRPGDTHICPRRPHAAIIRADVVSDTHASDGCAPSFDTVSDTFFAQPLALARVATLFP